MGRYLAGERESVWADVRALGPVGAQHLEDVTAVAEETMRRVARHVARIADALPGLGFVPSSDRLPRHAPATGEDLAELERLDEAIGLPAAFAACLRHVGAVDFAGDCPALGVFYNAPHRVTGMPPGAGYPDPLVLPSIEFLSLCWDEHEPGDDFVVPFAPDELRKANISGGTHALVVPDTADPVLHGVAGRPGVTLVEYLRISISWGGFPGWSFAPQQVPSVLELLRTDPDF
jgi:hypothetical protein